MFTPTLRCECAQPASDRLMRKWCISWDNNKLEVLMFYLRNLVVSYRFLLKLL